MLKTVGIKSWFNGLESFTEDQNPVMGEAPEVQGVFVSAGFNAYGLTGCGGAGMALGEWILNGEPPYDIWSFDIRRFGGYHRADSQVLARSLEGQGHHYTIVWPREEMKAGRPLRRSAIYDRLAAKARLLRRQVRLGAAQLVRARRRRAGRDRELPAPQLARHVARSTPPAAMPRRSSTSRPSPSSRWSGAMPRPACSASAPPT